MMTGKGRLLVVDDDRNFRETLCELLESNGYAVRSAANGREALALLQVADSDLALCDWKMPDIGGEQFLKALASGGTLTTMPVLIMTAYGSGPNALQAMQLGAYDFVTKPLEMGKVLATVSRALHHQELQREVDELRRQRFHEADPELAVLLERVRSPLRMVGSSPAWIEIFKNIGKVARTDVGVLILGESGTGKEMVARAIHENSSRSRSLLSSSTAPRCPQTCLNLSCLDMSVGLSPAPSPRRSVSSKRPRAALFFWMRLANCRWPCNPNCCASCRNTPLNEWARPHPCMRMFAWWQQPIACWIAKWKERTFVPICITA